MKKVIVISAHPDDETIGCGGTLLRHKANGEQVYWLIVTNIDTENGWNKAFVERRQKEIDKVSEKFSFEKTFKLNFPAAKLETLPMGELVSSISKVMHEVQPEVVYLLNGNDVHTDHQITFQAAYSCTKNFRYPFIKRILTYECLSETEFAPAFPDKAFVPNVFVDVSDFMDKKLEILNIYNSEIMEGNLPRSISAIKALAQYRGSRIGKPYAEAFSLIFENIND